MPRYGGNNDFTAPPCVKELKKFKELEKINIVPRFTLEIYLEEKEEN